MTTKRTAPPQAPEPGAIYIRNTNDLRELRTVPRLRTLARDAGASEAHIGRALLLLGRALLLLGLAQAERDPGLLGRAGALARGEK